MIIKKFDEFINEDTSSTGGPAVSGGMGAVVSSQPSGLAGTTIGTNWASGGGTTGSGDISIPYNPSGSNRVFHQMSMGKNHGPMTGKKSRVKKMDLKSLKSAFDNKRKKKSTSDKSTPDKKVMSFDNFLKTDVTTIKR